MTPELKQQPQQLQHTDDGEHKKRRKSAGEITFDWLVYGGIGWVVNAALSVIAIDQFNDGALKGMARHGKGLFNRAYSPFIKNPDRLTTASDNSFFISTIYSGGTLVLLPIRWIEKHKGSIVRWFDRKFHGDDATNDPKLQQMHQDMDNAPQQSWDSLIQARALALPVGLALSPLMGDQNALSTRVLNEKNILSGYSSFARISAKLSRKMTGFFRPDLKPEMMAAAASSPHQIQPTERRGVKILGYTVYDLALSAIVTIGFYITSKVFASWRDERKQLKEIKRAIHTGEITLKDGEENPLAAAEGVQPVGDALPDRKEAPKPQVHRVTREQHLANKAQVEALL